MCESKQIEPLFLIDEETVERRSKNCAHTNNDQAFKCKQKCRVTANELIDLYFKQLGRCSICGEGLTTETMQLDHIVEANYRMAYQMALNGVESPFGPIADITNLQWCHKTCNSLKEFCRRNGKQMHDFLFAVAEQSAAGFPLRSCIVTTGRMATKRNLRREFLQALFDQKGNALTVKEAKDAINGQDFDCCEQVLTDDLRWVGWKGVSERTAKRIAAIRLMAAECTEPMKSKADWYRLFNSRTKHDLELRICAVRFHQLIEANGISLCVSDSGNVFHQNVPACRHPSSSDKAAVLRVAKTAWTDGVCRDAIVAEIESPNRPKFLIEAAIDELASLGRLQQSLSDPQRLVYGLDRKEAACLLGVSPNRLKKFGTRCWDYLSDRPTFFKPADKPKGRCFYAVDALMHYKERRGRHPLDMACRVG